MSRTLGRGDSSLRRAAARLRCCFAFSFGSRGRAVPAHPPSPPPPRGGKPLPVRRHHNPRSVRRTGVTNHVLVGGHVIVPALTLGTSPSENFQRFAGSSRRLRNRSRCSSLRDVQKEFPDHEPAAREMAFERADVFEPFLPDSGVMSDPAVSRSASSSGCTRTISTSS